MAEKKPATKAGKTPKTSTAKSKTKAAERTAPKTVRATVTAKNGLNVRTTPEKGDNVKRVLPYGAKVTVLSQTTDAAGTEWAQIAPKEFIMRRFLKTV